MASGTVLLVANSDWYLYNFRLALAQYLQGHDLDVVMVSPQGKFVAEITAAGYRHIAWNVGRRTMSPPGEAVAVARLASIYRAEKPALVHHFTIKPVLYGSLAARFANSPAVVNSVTGLGYVFLTASRSGGLMRRLILPFYRHALAYPKSRVIFENENDRATFVQLGLVRASESVIIRGVGVNAGHFQPVPEPDLPEPLIVFPSRMLFDKGLGTLVEAARILKSRVSVRIALVGDTDPGNPTTAREAELRAWEKEGLVEWWGFQSDMRAVYQGCTVVTLPSFGEGLPTVLIEAAACGRPIVTTDVAGCREVVQDGVNGLLVPPNQPEALAQALETLITDPQLRRQMGLAGRQMVLDRFTDNLVNSQTFAIYRELLASGARS